MMDDNPSHFSYLDGNKEYGHASIGHHNKSVTSSAAYQRNGKLKNELDMQLLSIMQKSVDSAGEGDDGASSQSDRSIENQNMNGRAFSRAESLH